MGLISRVSSRTYSREKMLRLFRSLTPKAPCQPLSTSATLDLYNKRSHLRNNHLELVLDSQDNENTYLDFLGPQYSKQYQGIVNNYAPNIRATVVKFMIKKPARPNSGNRRYCKVKLCDRQRIVHAKSPHQGHTLQEHNAVNASWWELERGKLDFGWDQPGKKFHRRNR